MGTNKKLCCNDLLAPRYKLQPVMDSIYISEGQNLKFGSVVDCKGFLCGSTHLEPYAILYEDCDTTNGAQEANVLIMGEFNIEKLVFGEDATGDVLDKIVFYAKKNSIIIRPYDYAPSFTPPEVSSIENVIPEGTSQTNPLINAEETQRMIDDSIHEVTLDPSEVALGNVHNLDEVTSFAADAKILVDSETNGPGAMPTEDLLKVTAQNAINGNIAKDFDNTIDYKSGAVIIRNVNELRLVTADFTAGNYNDDKTQCVTIEELDEFSKVYSTFGILKLRLQGNNNQRRLVFQNDGNEADYKIVFPNGAWDTSTATYGYLYVKAFDADGSSLGNLHVVGDMGVVTTNYTIDVHLPKNTAFWDIELRGKTDEIVNIIVGANLGSRLLIVENETRKNSVDFSVDGYLGSIVGDNQNPVDVLFENDGKDKLYYLVFPSGAWDLTGVDYGPLYVTTYDENDTKIADIVVRNNTQVSAFVAGETIAFNLGTGVYSWKVRIRAKSGVNVLFRVKSSIPSRLFSVETKVGDTDVTEIANVVADNKIYFIDGINKSVVGNNMNLSEVTFTNDGSDKKFVLCFPNGPWDLTGVDYGPLYITTYDKNGAQIADVVVRTNSQVSSFVAGEKISFNLGDGVFSWKVKIRAKSGSVVEFNLNAEIANRLASVEKNIGLGSNSYEGRKIDVGGNYYDRKLLYTTSQLTPPLSIAHNNPQAIAVYADKIIRTNSNSEGNYPASIYITDFNGNVLGEFELTGELADFHCNGASLGVKYDESDNLPLLYISETNGSRRFAAIRIANDYSSYTLVQTIAYSGTHLQNYSWNDWCIDIENKILFAYQKYGASSDRLFTAEVVAFALPSISSSSVTLGDSDIIDDFVVKGVYMNQQAIVKNGLMYAACGLDNVNSPFEFVVIDLANHSVITRLNLSWLGEPEGIAISNGRLFISSGSIYELFT